nr:MAG TPA: hypothetical protein [Crassvirales sp.]
MPFLFLLLDISKKKQYKNYKNTIVICYIE